MPATATARANDQRRLHFHGALSGLVRDEELHGRPHVVAPVVMLREMVLEQDNGTGELIPADELERSAEMQLWEGRPVTVGHPEVDGRFVSAGVLDAADETQVGTIRNVEAVDEGTGVRLRAEAWIDRQMAERVDGGEDILDRLDEFREAENLGTATPLEVSTGYWSRFRAEGGSHNGRSYRGIQEAIIPDHLALLPNGIGRCSLEDGCGMPRLNRNGNPVAAATLDVSASLLSTDGSADRLGIAADEVETTVLSSARMPRFSGTADGEDGGAWPPTLAEFAKANGWEDADGWDDLTEDQRNALAQGTLLGEAGETFAGSMVFPVVDVNGDLRADRLEAVLDGRADEADVPEGALASARNMARVLLETEFDRDLSENASDDMRLRLDVSGLADSVRETLREHMGEVLDRVLGRNQGESLDDQREALGDLVEESEGGRGVFTWIVEMFEDEVIYAVDPDGEAEELFRAPWSVEDGDVSIAFGDAVQVERVTEFVPVTDEAADGGRRLTVEKRYEPLLQIQGIQMNRDELIQRLSDCGSCPFRRETLEAMDDDELVAAANASEVDFEGNLEDGTSEDGGSDEPGATDGGEDEPATNQGGDADGDEGRVTLSPDEYEAFQALVADREATREETIEFLVENEDCVVPESELRQLSDETLQRYADNLREIEGAEGDRRNRRTFAARGGRRNDDVPGKKGEDYFDKNPRTPSIVTRNVGDRRQMNAGSQGD